MTTATTTTRLHLAGRDAKRAWKAYDDAVAAHPAAVAAATAKGKAPPPDPKLGDVPMQHYSWRGVKLRRLSPSERALVNVETSKKVETDTSNLEWEAMRAREGLLRSIVAVTIKDELTPVEYLDPKSWTPVTTQQLCGVGGTAYAIDTLFTAKDMATLELAYRSMHEVTGGDIEAILGEAVEEMSD